MKTARTNREDIYVSPVLVGNLFDDTRKEVGNEILTSRKYKVLREGWITAMFAVALSLHEKRIWWIRPNKADVAPDYYAFTRTDPDKQGYREGINREIEVFEWGIHSENSLAEAILEKIKGWKAEKISVICYASKQNQLLEFVRLNRVLKTLQLGVLEIWILANIKELNADFVVQVYPYFLPLYVPNQVPANFTKPYAFIKKKRGKNDELAGKVEINAEMEIKILTDCNYSGLPTRSVHWQL